MRVLHWLLLCLGVVLLVLANVLFWVDRTLLNSDRFASAVDEVMAKPEVQDRMATVISQEAAPEIDLQSRLRSRLPDELQFIVPLVGDSVTEELVYRVSLRVLSSDATASARDDVVRNLHDQLVRTLEGDDDKALRAEGDSLVLDLRPLISRVFERVGLPMPARLQQAAAEGRGVIVLVEDNQALGAASFFLSNRVLFLVLALFAAIACLAGAVMLSSDRTRGIAHAGFAVATAGVLTLLIRLIGNSFIPDERLVLRELVHALEANLRKESILLLAIGAIIALGTDAGIRAHVAAAQRSISVQVQRIGTGTSLLIALGVVALVLIAT
jgi:hypothetical protein